MDPERFEKFEDDHSVFNIKIQGVPVWERIRTKIVREILRQNLGNPHGAARSTLQNYFRSGILMGKNIVYRNPYLESEKELLFFGHSRRKNEFGNQWWDIYCDPIHTSSEFDYIQYEKPFKMMHYTPAKTKNLRYLDSVELGSKLLSKLKIRRAEIPEEIIVELSTIEMGLRKEFDADINIKNMVKESFDQRRTKLYAYAKLLEKIKPSLVVLVVSYGRETFIEACKQKNIPVAELQHGIIHKTQFGYSYRGNKTKQMFPDYLLTFGEYWKDQVEFPIPKERVIPVGYPYLEKGVENCNHFESEDQIVFLSQGTIGKQLSKIAVELENNKSLESRVIYKLHPSEYDGWKDRYPWLINSNVQVVDRSDPPLYEIFSRSSTQIGVGSTALYEGLCFGLETYIYECERSHVMEDLVKNDGAYQFNSSEDLIQKLDETSSKIHNLEHYFTPNARDNTRQIISELVKDGTVYQNSS